MALLAALAALPARASYNLDVAADIIEILKDTAIKEFVDFDDLGFLKAVELIDSRYCSPDSGSSVRRYALVVESASRVRKEPLCRYTVTVDNCLGHGRVRLDKKPVCSER